MGLPLISMETDSYMGRQGASYLLKLGLDDFIARDTEAYVEKAVQLAADTQPVAALRETLRSKVDSEIFDYDQHIQELETAYCYMIERFRTGKPPIPFNVRDNSATEPNR